MIDFAAGWAIRLASASLIEFVAFLPNSNSGNREAAWLRLPVIDTNQLTSSLTAARRYWNALDLAITAFCAVTLVVIFFSGCSAKGEEVFDTFLLVIRNLFQFGRLVLVLRK